MDEIINCQNVLQGMSCPFFTSQLSMLFPNKCNERVISFFKCEEKA